MTIRKNALTVRASNKVVSGIFWSLMPSITRWRVCRQTLKKVRPPARTERSLRLVTKKATESTEIAR